MLDVDIKIKHGSLTLRPSEDDQLHLESDPPLVPKIHGSTVEIDTDGIAGPVHATVYIPVPSHRLDANIGRGPCSITALSLRSADVNVGLGDFTAEESQGKWDINVGKGDALITQLDGMLDINMGMGRLEIVQFHGEADINSGLGAVIIQKSDGRYDINAGKGDVSWEDTAGSARINAGIGAVDIIRGQGTGLEVQTGLGKVSLLGGSWDSADINTGLGDIRVTGRVSRLVATAKQRGHISVSLGLETGARAEASTDRGRIISSLNLMPVGHAGPQRGERMVGVVGDGAGEIRLHTRRGDVTLAAAPQEDSEVTPDEDARLFILRELQKGRLTVDEAETLLQTLEDESHYG